MTSDIKNTNSNETVGTGLQLELTVVDGKPTACSLGLSQNFQKRHDHVLRDIEHAISSHSREFSIPNFGESSYIDSRGKVQKKYLMTRDGFAVMAMGFKGPTAARFKEAYINEFNRMEQALTERAKQLAYLKQNELELARPWAQEVEDKLVGYWRFTKTDTQALGVAFGHLIARLPVNVFSETKSVELRESYVHQFLYGLTQTKHDLQIVTPGNRYAMALVVLSAIGARMTVGINDALVTLSENPM